MSQLIRLLGSIRAPLEDEKETQRVIAEHLDAAGVGYRREVRLSEKDIVDFMIEGAAIEVKIKGSRANILRQLERYSAHADVKQLILLTSRSVLLPRVIGGKPACSVSLSRAWL